MTGRMAALLLLAWCPAVAAQVPGFPVDSPPPVRLLPPVVSGVPQAFEFIETPWTDSTPIRQPLPPDSCPRNPFACSNDPFRNVTPSGLAVTCFPQSLFWEPPLAIRREPRLSMTPTTLSNGFTNDTLDINVGAVAGLSRFEREGNPFRVQLDVFGVILTRISQYDYLVGSDYRGGLPLTFESGPWHGKAAYEHTSAHLGDETLLRTGRARVEYTKDELVFGLGRWFASDRLRLYGETAWAFFQNIPNDPSPLRFDLGAEWRPRFATGFWGVPYAAANVDFYGTNDFRPGFAAQAGWLWRAPDRRLSQFRVYLEYYTGNSPYGQFVSTTESFVGLGVALDY